MIRLRLDVNSGVPLGLQIERQLRLAVAVGRLAPGERLPGARELAAQLRVNFHTVRKAYGALEDAGVLRVEQGRGTFVAADAPPMRAADLRRRVRRHVERLLEDLSGADIPRARLESIIAAELRRAYKGGGAWRTRSGRKD